jgi:hypothetical protein
MTWMISGSRDAHDACAIQHAGHIVRHDRPGAVGNRDDAAIVEAGDVLARDADVRR